jgi:membrane protease YdiL (CAAX protease family)
MVSETLLMAPGLLALLLAGVPLKDGAGLHRINPRTSLLSLGTGATLWLASLGLLELQYAVWRPPADYLEAFRQLHESLRPSGVLDAALSVLAIAVFPAVCEEILVRGIVLPAFARTFGPGLAVVGSALGFGLMHLDPYRFPFTLGVGLALGLVRLRTGSVLPTVLAHTALNTLTFALAPLFDDPSAPMPEPQPLLGLGLLVVGVGFWYLTLRCLRR